MDQRSDSVVQYVGKSLTGEAYVLKHDVQTLFKRSAFFSVLASTFSYTSAGIPDGVYSDISLLSKMIYCHVNLVVQSSPTLPYGEDLRHYFWLCSIGHCRIPS